MERKFTFESEEYLERAYEFKVFDTDTESETYVDTKQMYNDLVDTLKANPDRAWVCANEIGYGVRAAAVRFEDDIKEFFNPVFQLKDEVKLSRERDYYDNKEYLILRYNEITLWYQDMTCNPDKDVPQEKAVKLSKDAAVVMHQVIACLDGIHPHDIGLEIIPEFDEATDEERQEIIDAYLDDLKKLYTDLDEELKKEDEVNRYWDSYKFEMAKKRGDVKVEKVEENPPLNRRQRRLLNKITKKLGKGKKND